MPKSLQELLYELEATNSAIDRWLKESDDDLSAARLEQLKAKRQNLKRAIKRRQEKEKPVEPKPIGRPRKGRGTAISFSYEESVALNWEGLSPQEIKARLLSQVRRN